MNFKVKGRFELTSKYCVGKNLPEASSSPRILQDSEPYKPAPDLYCPDTVRTQSGRQESRLAGQTCSKA